MSSTLLGLILAMANPSPVVDQLPDIIIWQDVLSDYVISTTGSGEPPAGRPCLRMSTATANIGDGRLELRGGTIINQTTQEVNQRIYRSNGTFYDRSAGTFVYHPTHGHIHFDNWTVFKLRTVLAGGGVGPVVKQGAKTSFCILELRTYDDQLPGYNVSPGYNSCGQVQGLRPGRSDVYDYSLDDQYIDITGVPNGQYWLEGTVDPNDKVLEKDETNNTARILVNIGPIPTATPDVYEDNDTVAQVNAKIEGGPNSANLGLINSLRTITNLSIEDSFDYFKFKLNKTGGAGDYIQISSPYNVDIDLRLCNSSGTVLSSSTSNTGYDYVSLSGRAAGYYFARVDKVSSNNPLYTLKIEPAGNLPPSITPTSPVLPIWVEKAYSTIPVTWLCSDPEGDPKTVSLYASMTYGSGSPIQLLSYQNMPGTNQFANVNTANIAVGNWYLLFRCSDGGAVNDVWNKAKITIFKRFDLNWDDAINLTDWNLYVNQTIGASKVSVGLITNPDWITLLDHNENKHVDMDDIAEFYEMTHP